MIDWATATYSKFYVSEEFQLPWPQCRL